MSFFNDLIARITLGLMFLWFTASPFWISALLYLTIIRHSVLATVVFVLVWSTPFIPGVQVGWKWFQQLGLWRVWRNFFSYRIVKTAPLRPGKQFLCAIAPHGVFPMGSFLLTGLLAEYFNEVDMASIRAAVASVFFMSPIYSVTVKWMGGISADKKTIKRALEAGQSVFIHPGGIAGIYHADHQHEEVYLRKRKGFCKLALETGVDLVPCYAFGHTQVLHKIPQAHSFIERMSRRLRISLVYFYGPSVLLPIPYKRPITMVVGAPIPVQKTEKPTKLQVEQLHAQFLAALQSLFEAHKADCLPPGHRNLKEPLSIA